MQTMKLIDLFIKIAKGEDTPEKIEFQGNIYSHNGDTVNSYYYCKEINKLLEDVYTLEELNYEVKIIEDITKDPIMTLEGTPNSIRKDLGLSIPEDKKIGKLYIPKICDHELQSLITSLNVINKEIEYKINEIIDKINGE